MTDKRRTGSDTINEWLDDMATKIREYYDGRGISDFAMIGIHTGGVWVGRALAERLQPAEPLGELNIAFYRDDFSQIGMQPVVEPSRLPFDVDNRHVLLVDDILYTGRTVRAAMNEIFDWGRPASITLTVLVDRGGRQLPVDAAVTGHRLPLAEDEHVKLTGPSPLELSVLKRG